MHTLKDVTVTSKQCTIRRAANCRPYSRRRAFTMIELIVVSALLGLLAVLVIPRVLWEEPPKRILQRAFIEAVDIAKDGASVRFRIDKEENKGAIITEILVKDDEAGKAENVWKALKMRWEPAGNAWIFDPEMIYFYQDGVCTPAKIVWGTPPYQENYLLTVTGYLVESGNF